MSYIPENHADFAELESIIARHGLGAVLLALGEICYVKAEHLRANWQDRVAAREWDHVGNRCSTLGDKIEV